MDEKNALDNNYHLLRINLTQELFSRQEKISFNNTLGTEIDFNTKRTKLNKEKLFTVTTALSITGTQAEKDNKTKEAFKLQMIFKGYFKVVGEPELPFEDFCKFNAPALLFPFIREHVASITSKAGMPTLMLPTVAFSKINS